MELRQLNLGYSLKNIPIPSKQEYLNLKPVKYLVANDLLSLHQHCLYNVLYITIKTMINKKTIAESIKIA